ncbi:hypothetical protein GCM10022240_00730 [Microbacterium kribbense]|uniref:Mannitol-1-phosphate 5-dehydrogenase n=1 Tax=Microbacterium kribbense TaxID=433645 RepID=A0ABP7FZ51_9MICO
MSDPTGARPLTRSAVGAPAAPVRIVHLGLGAFHRAHQAWYTQRAGDGWGIAAFTGRSPRAAEPLAAQDGVFALVERSAQSDAVEVITSISEARDGADLQRLGELLADPQVGVVTLTITEAGYRLGPDGQLDQDDADVVADIRALRRTSLSSSSAQPRGSRGARTESAESALGSADLLASAEGVAPPEGMAPPEGVAPPEGAAPDGGMGEKDAPTTPLGRLLLALQARRAAGAGPIAVVSCDNIPANGAVTARAVTALAARVDADLAAWVRENVSFVGTSVDRITPAHTGEVDAVIEAGWHDRATVITEPFTDWVLQGDFPAGRPAWERGGARFVDEIGPWEDRKLWLLNGAHTILATAGPVRGYDTVAAAFADPDCRALVDAFWAEAVTCLPAGVEHVEYRRQLAERFANARIVHRLDQIAGETTTKIRYRIVPIVTRLRARGEDAAACADALAAWIAVAADIPAADRESQAVAAAASSADPIGELLRLVGADIDADFVARVRGTVAATV